MHRVIQLDNSERMSKFDPCASFRPTMTEFEKDQQASPRWQKRFRWCRCGEPFDEELEAVTALLIENYITVQQARESLAETREILSAVLQSYTKKDALEPGHQEYYATIGNDLAIADEFTSRVEQQPIAERQFRKELLKRIIMEYRAHPRAI